MRWCNISGTRNKNSCMLLRINNTALFLSSQAFILRGSAVVQLILSNSHILHTEPADVLADLADI